MSYIDFLKRKQHTSNDHGFDPVWMPDFLFPFQRDMVEWALNRGRCSLFEDCGLGKTPQQLVWAENIRRKTGGNVLVLTPLAVSAQTVREGEKFGIGCWQTRGGNIKPGINVTNYEQLHHYKPDDFIAVVCDESSAIKHFEGKRQRVVTDFMRHLPYRLLCTATAAPNDFIELGTSAEALGQMGRMDMLSTFFRNDENSLHPVWWGARWRFRPHAEQSFWQWVCSWARALRKPSDIGHDDNGFILPNLTERETVVKNASPLNGYLFVQTAQTLQEQREERKATLPHRCEAVADIATSTSDPVVCWGHYNEETDTLSKIIPGAVQVSGSDSDEQKESKFLDFANGNIRVLVTKPKIGAFGLNWQHCNHMTFFPSHSFEQYYQGVRRCWRFGQQNPVTVDIITTEGELGVLKNLQRKSEQASRMFDMLIEYMNDAITLERISKHTIKEEIPSWL